MDPMAAGTAVLLLVDLLGGVTAGIFASASVASLHEDQDFSLTGQAPDSLCEGGRSFHGLYIRGSGFVSDTLRGDGYHVADEDDPGDNSDQGPHGQEPER